MMSLVENGIDSLHIVELMMGDGGPTRRRFNSTAVDFNNSDPDFPGTTQKIVSVWYSAAEAVAWNVRQIGSGWLAW